MISLSMKGSKLLMKMFFYKIISYKFVQKQSIPRNTYFENEGVTEIQPNEI